MHPDVPYIDACISMSMASYIQDPLRVLREINARMSIAGRIVVVDYNNFFNIIPNAAWLNDDQQIMDMFEKAGFRVNIKRIKGMLWDFVIIHGEKVKNVYSFYYVSSHVRKKI